MANLSWSQSINKTINGTLYTEPDLTELYKHRSLEAGLNITRLILIPVGVSVMAVLLAALFRSPTIRASMRNQCGIVLCCACVLYLCVVLPLYFTMLFGKLFITDNCHMAASYYNFGLILKFTGNWTLLIFVGSLLGNVCGIHPENKFSAPRLLLLRTAVLLTPCLLSVTSVMLIIRAHLSEEEFEKYGCFIEVTEAPRVMRSFNTSIPLILSVLVLLVVAVMTRWTADRQHVSDNEMSTQLLDGPAPVMEHWVYTLAVAVTLLFEIPDVVEMFLDIQRMNFSSAITFYLISSFLMELQILVTPMTWFLFRDIRGEITSWRRCFRSTRFRTAVAQYKREGDTIECHANQGDTDVCRLNQGDTIACSTNQGDTIATSDP